MTNNDTAFYAFFHKLNGKVYNSPEQMRVDFNAALDESGLEVTPKKATKTEVIKKVTKKLTFNKQDKKKKKK
jgi:hypothetical protein